MEMETALVCSPRSGRNFFSTTNHAVSFRLFILVFPFQADITPPRWGNPDGINCGVKSRIRRSSGPS